MFVFVTDDPFFFYEKQRARYAEPAFARMLLVHEYGHTVQSLLLGPLYLIAVGLPSLLWSYLPGAARKRKEGGASYFSVYPENWANRLGERVAREPSLGRAV